MAKSERAKLAESYRKTWRNIEKRMGNVIKHYGRTPGIRAFENAVEKNRITKSTRGKSLEVLQKMTRELDYLNNLKSTTVEGARTYQNVFKDMEEKFRAIGQQEMFWKLYNRMVDEYGYEKIAKYQYMEVVSEVLNDTNEYDIDTLYQKAKNLFDGVEQGGNNEIELSDIWSSK